MASVGAMSSEKSASAVCAIIVSYFPDLAVLRRVIAAIRPQVHALVIVDNGSDARVVTWLRARAMEQGFNLVECGRNLGIGAAHNLGISRARDGGCSHVLLLDQDSCADHDMVAGLLTLHHALTADGIKVSAVGPRYRDPRSGHSSFFVRFKWLRFARLYCRPDTRDQYIEADFLITSGSLIALSALSHIGEMDAALFVDHVDTEWFLRARHKGYRAFGACNAIMHHSLGSDTHRLWLGRWRHVPEHSPFRHYYIFRNSILLYKRSYAPLIWIMSDVLRLLGMFIFYSACTRPRRQHAAMMIKGILDGLRGRTGPLSPA
jgi:rhamnosyltransferase